MSTAGFFFVFVCMQCMGVGGMKGWGKGGTADLHFGSECGARRHCSTRLGPNERVVVLIVLLMRLRLDDRSRAHQSTLGVSNPCSHLQHVCARCHVCAHTPARQWSRSVAATTIAITSFVTSIDVVENYPPQHGSRMQTTGIKVTVRRRNWHVRVRCAVVEPASKIAPKCLQPKPNTNTKPCK